MALDIQAKKFWSAFCEDAEALRLAALSGQLVGCHT